jgi:hypothetical protein
LKVRNIKSVAVDSLTNKLFIELSSRHQAATFLSLKIHNAMREKIALFIPKEFFGFSKLTADKASISE